ncbi:glycosyltransferase family 2 protein [Bradyrhizobium sp. ARR65]|uniref:glycosyltransferase family 2 protein n=1 Tax=Bradyrhizobium sp. ARR65 TaxID=1040989 RepID=UPI000464C0FD|nr:glycosyltransferase family 2 protein [Bradyrhizobium sp. ARR65]
MVLIVGFRNPQDICACLTALARAKTEPSFDIFICENGGSKSFRELFEALSNAEGPCITVENELPAVPLGRLVQIKRLVLKGRSSRVEIALAERNLGYAGGVNAGIDYLSKIPGWQGIWILNPDSQPEPDALSALVQRSITANKGMVGSTILPVVGGDYIHCRGGLYWRKLIMRPALLGYRQRINEPFDLEAMEDRLDCVSGASLYVSRKCLEQVGPMDERFFLYYEDADWGIRAKRYGLGYASASIVPHKGGTTIGSFNRSQLSVYLQSRNRILYIRMHFPRSLLWGSLLSLAYAMQYLLAGSPRNFKTALAGLWAGLKGEIGPPPPHIFAEISETLVSRN